jgi:hypothetical protein
MRAYGQRETDCLIRPARAANAARTGIALAAINPAATPMASRRFSMH